MCVHMCVCACLSVRDSKYLFCWWVCVSLCASVHLVHYTLPSLFHLLCVSFSITLRSRLLLFPLQINEVTSNHLRRLLNNDDELWQCIADQGDLKVYKRELEENGIVIDPVKAVCTVKVCAWALTLTLSKLFAQWRYMPLHTGLWICLCLRCWLGFVLGGKKLVGKILTAEWNFWTDQCIQWFALLS